MFSQWPNELNGLCVFTHWPTKLCSPAKYYWLSPSNQWISNSHMVANDSVNIPTWTGEMLGFKSSHHEIMPIWYFICDRCCILNYHCKNKYKTSENGKTYLCNKKNTLYLYNAIIFMSLRGIAYYWVTALNLMLSTSAYFQIYFPY